MKSLKIITTVFFLFVSTSSFSQLGELGSTTSEIIEMLKSENYCIIDSLSKIEYKVNNKDTDSGYRITAKDDNYAVTYFFSVRKVCFASEFIPLNKESEEEQINTLKESYTKIGKNKYMYVYNNIACDIEKGDSFKDGKKTTIYRVTYHKNY